MKVASVTIRRARPDDFPEIVKMTRDLASHIGTEFRPKVNVDVLKFEGPFGRDRFRILVAESGNTILGFCLYSFVFSGWRGCCGLFVEDLYVEHSARGSGIGKQLLTAALEAEHDDGAGFIKLEVALSNKSAVSFYKKMGFTLFEGEALMLLEANQLTRNA